MGYLLSINRFIKIHYKKLVSYRKKDWHSHDYPIEFRTQEVPDLTGTNFTMYPWDARILNWYQISGCGHSKQEAYLDLKQTFENYIAQGNVPPRPGNKVPIVFVSTNAINEYEKEAIHFCRVILEMDYYEIFISDQSSLTDFYWTDVQINHKLQAIQDVYGMQVEDRKELLLVNILKQIRESENYT